MREAVEEVGLRPDSVALLGSLPPLFIPPSRFWLQTVVAAWEAPHRLVAAEAEVAEVLAVRLSLLTDPATWRSVRLTVSGWSWAWALPGGHLLWGATGVVTASLLAVLDPGWSRGLRPADLADREVRPRRRAARTASTRALLPGTPERSARELAAAGGWRPPAGHGGTAAAGAVVAEAVTRVAGPGAQRVLVLAGDGGDGAVGRAAARNLSRLGLPVAVVATAEFPGTLPEADVVVDALVGDGLRGPLRGTPLAMAAALRESAATVVSVDLPSGLSPVDGIVGELVAADVTVELAPPRPVLSSPRVAPFAGDRYAVLPGGPGEPGVLVRVVDLAP